VRHPTARGWEHLPRQHAGIRSFAPPRGAGGERFDSDCAGSAVAWRAMARTRRRRLRRWLPPLWGGSSLPAAGKLGTCARRDALEPECRVAELKPPDSLRRFLGCMTRPRVGTLRLPYPAAVGERTWVRDVARSPHRRGDLVGRRPRGLSQVLGQIVHRGAITGGVEAEAADELLDDHRLDFCPVGRGAEQALHRGDPLVGDAARHDEVEGR